MIALTITRICNAVWRKKTRFYVPGIAKHYTRDRRGFIVGGLAQGCIACAFRKASSTNSRVMWLAIAQPTIRRVNRSSTAHTHTHTYGQPSRVHRYVPSDGQT